MFKVGDKVRCIDNTFGYNQRPMIGEEYIVVRGKADRRGWVKLEGKMIGGNLDKNTFREIDFELVTNHNNMNLTEKFTQLFMSEPEKSFRKAGIIDGDNLLTSEGTKIFLTWMLKKHKDEFQKDVVSELLKEEEKKC